MAVLGTSMENATMRYTVPNQLKRECEAEYLATASDSDAAYYRQRSHAEKLKLLQGHFSAKFALARGDGRWAKQVQDFLDIMSRATDA
jgi:hypothetical protein